MSENSQIAYILSELKRIDRLLRSVTGIGSTPTIGNETIASDVNKVTLEVKAARGRYSSLLAHISSIWQAINTFSTSIIKPHALTVHTDFESYNDIVDNKLDGPVESLLPMDTVSLADLTWSYTGGKVRFGPSVFTISGGTVTLTDNATNYIYIDSTGTVSKNTTGFTAGELPIAVITTVSGVGTYVDKRVFLSNDDNSTMPQYAGIFTKPTVHDDGDGKITLGDGVYTTFSDVNFSRPILFHSVAGATYEFTDKAINYMVYNDNTGLIEVITSRDNINQSNVIPILTVYRDGINLQILDWDTMSKGLGNKLSDRLVRTQRFVPETGGLVLGELATRRITLTGGKVWYGAANVTLDPCDSSTTATTLFYHSGTDWLETAITQYNNTQYDDGTGLQTLSGASKYGVNWIFRAIEDSEQLYVVLGNNSYTLNEAQAATLPSNLPAKIISTGLLVGRIIVKKDTDTAADISSAFSSTLNLSGVTKPAGATTEIQYNDTGSFGSSSLFKWDTTNNGLIVPFIRPEADSTSAFCLKKADGTTNVVRLDTTNGISEFFLVPLTGINPAMRLVSNSTTTGDGVSIDLAGSTNSTATTGRIAAVRTGTNGTGDLIFYSRLQPDTIERMRILSTGHISMGGIFTPTARLHLAAGTATAGTAPLKLTSGTLTTAAEAGAIEFLTDKYYATITTGTARKELTLNDIALPSTSIPIATATGRLTGSSDFTCTGGVLTLRNLGAAQISCYDDTNAFQFVFGTSAAQSAIFMGSVTDTKFQIRTKNTVRITVLGDASGGNTGFGVATPTATLHLKAGTTGAGTAPLKFNTGSLMTAAEAGAVEFLTDKWYATITTGTARKELTLNDIALTTGRIPFTTTNGRLTDEAGFTRASGITKIGDGTNYTEFEADGTIAFSGTATVFDDLRVNLANVKAPASDSPNWTLYKSCELPAYSATATNTLYFNAQLPHTYKQGSDLVFHMHVIYPNANAGNSVWRLTYSWANVDGTFPSETTETLTFASPVAGDTNKIHAFTTISGTGKTMSSVLICSLTRLGGDVADTYASVIYAVQADFHFEIDTVGSRTITAK